MLPYVTFYHLCWNKTLEFLRSCDIVFASNLWFLKVGFRIFNYLKTSVAILFYTSYKKSGVTTFFLKEIYMNFSYYLT